MFQISERLCVSQPAHQRERAQFDVCLSGEPPSSENNFHVLKDAQCNKETLFPPIEILLILLWSLHFRHSHLKSPLELHIFQSSCTSTHLNSFIAQTYKENSSFQ